MTTVAGEEVHRIDYTARDGSAGVVFIGGSPVTVATHYGTLTVNPDGTYSYTPDESLLAVNGLDTTETLTDPVTFTQNSDGSGSSAVVTYTITGVNDAPIADADGPYSTNEDTPLVVNAANGVLAGDHDPDNDDGSVSDTLTPVVTDNVDHGVLTMNPDGSFTYTPAADFFGTDSFTYHAFDGTANSNDITVTINVNAVAGDPYDARDDGSDPSPAGEPGGFNPFIVQDEDTPATYTIGTVGGPAAGGNFLANDLNPDQDIIHVDSISNLFDAVSGLQVGTITYNETAGTYTITPFSNYNGDAYFDYVATDRQNTPADTSDDQSDQARVFVRITSVNDAPVSGGAQTVSESEDQDLTFTLPAASDNQGGAPNENNTITYTLVPGSVTHNGTTVGDGNITINPVTGQWEYNGQAMDQSLDTGEQNVVTFQYVANDNGTPAGTSAPATVTLNVTGVNDAPVANPDYFATGEDQALARDASRNLLTGAGETPHAPPAGADTDVDVEPLTAVAATGSTSGGGTYQVFTDGTFTYTPAANYNGNDTFTYRAFDGTAQSNDATVTIAVATSPDAPTANDDGPFNVTEDVPGQAQGLQTGGGVFRTNANGFFDERQLTGAAGSTTGPTTGPGPANGVDSDPDAGAPGNLDITSVGAAQGGTVQLFVAGNGTQYVVFTPFANYSGPAGFDYAVTDPDGNSDIGHVTLRVQEASDGGPTAVNDTLNATEQTALHVTAAQLVGNDIDPDNNSSGAGTDQLVVRSIQNVQNATISNIVTDANGNIVSFDITPNSDVNGAPTSFDYVVDDAAARPAYPGDTAAPGAIGGTRVVGAPDTRSGTGLGTVTLNVTNVNDRPVATDDTLPGTTEDSTTGVTFTAAQLLANDHDADNNGNTNAGLTANIPTGHVNGGTITFNSGTGQYTFIPDANFNGNATFTYTVTDNAGVAGNGVGGSTSLPATVTIPVSAVNDNPIANPDVLTQGITLGQPVIAEDRSTVFSFDQFLANDSDVDIARGEPQGPLTIVGATSPQGTITNIDPVARTLTFTPTPGFSGPATITYTVSDQAPGTPGTANGTASFTVVDTVVGGSTGETLNAANNGQSTVIFGNGGNDTLNGTPQTDELYGGDGNDTLNGFGSNDFLRGGIGNDTANGGDGNDTLYMDDGGTDTANGDAGNDALVFGSQLDATDTVNGGAGTDTLALRGAYGTGTGGNSYFLSTSNMHGDVETLLLLSGSNTGTLPAPSNGPGPFSYFLTEQDSNVAAGQILTVIANAPRAGANGLQSNETLYFDGSDEKDGAFRIFAGQGIDNLIGGQGNDGFFFEGGAFTFQDQVDGRGGLDTLALRGDYSGGVTLTNVRNIENVSLLSGHNNPFGGQIVPGGYDYTITLSQNNVAAGQTLTVNGNSLQSDETLTVNSGAVRGGNLIIIGGAAADDLSGGLQTFHVGNVQTGQGGTDLIYGGLGGDRMDGGRAGNGPFGDDDGSNVYLYRQAAESGGSQVNIDHIQGFNYQLDRIDINQGGAVTNGFAQGTGIAGVNVTDVNAVFNGTFTDTPTGSLNNGVLDDSEFFAQLGAQLDNALNPGQAAFLQVTNDFSGQYNGSTIFVADTNGNGSVDTGDLVIVFDNLQGQLPPSTEFIM